MENSGKLIWALIGAGILIGGYFVAKEQRADVRIELTRLQAQQTQLENIARTLRAQGKLEEAKKYEYDALMLTHQIQRLKWKLGL